MAAEQSPKRRLRNRKLWVRPPPRRVAAVFQSGTAGPSHRLATAGKDPIYPCGNSGVVRNRLWPAGGPL